MYVDLELECRHVFSGAAVIFLASAASWYMKAFIGGNGSMQTGGMESRYFELLKGGAIPGNCG